MNKYWNNQIVLITGCTGAIGHAATKKLLSLGCRVAGFYFSNEKKAEEMTKELSADKFMALKVDIRNSSDIAVGVKKINERFGDVSILINNAGIIQDSLVSLITDQQWYDMVNTHLTGTFFCTRAVLKSMIRNQFGRILAITSISALRGSKGHAHYAAVKAGQIAFTKSLSREVGKKNVLCNSLALGLVETPHMKQMITDEHYDYLVQSSSLRRVATLDQVSDLIESILSEKNNIITGHTYIADCGFF